MPPSSFVARQGGQDTSDMFRLTWGTTTHKDKEEPISLQDYHEAFLTSPVFQMELFLLSSLPFPNNTKNKTDWVSTMRQRSHLKAVAQGKETTMGPWTVRATEGDCRTLFSTTTLDTDGSSVASMTAATRIMQAHMGGT